MLIFQEVKGLFLLPISQYTLRWPTILYQSMNCWRNHEFMKSLGRYFNLSLHVHTLLNLLYTAIFQLFFFFQIYWLVLKAFFPHGIKRLFFRASEHYKLMIISLSRYAVEGFATGYFARLILSYVRKYIALIDLRLML